MSVSIEAASHSKHRVKRMQKPLGLLSQAQSEELVHYLTLVKNYYREAASKRHADVDLDRIICTALASQLSRKTGAPWETIS